MSLYGTGYPIISGSLGNVSLEHCTITPNFFVADVIEHTSVLSGHKSYPYSRNRSEFQLDVMLCNYSGSTSSSLAKFNDIYQYKDKYFYFIPHSDFTASIDGYGGGIEYFMAEFVPYYLNDDVRYDVISITLSPRKNSILYVRTDGGYGTSFGLYYGSTGW